jgi:hypothetical protein
MQSALASAGPVGNAKSQENRRTNRDERHALQVTADRLLDEDIRRKVDRGGRLRGGRSIIDISAYVEAAIQLGD